ncbi:MAG TPA: sigma 54-interacting transcriptional regulator [Clostridia bacterium]|nr:sigma 54-interacting transcriptional regulator [Clostridia bacterium]HRU41004.1 sigma 54-interacting transcriptional regulator [Candidatus Diapherotrites archaeon]
MAHLSEIKDFIQTVTEAITNSLDIESAVVDTNLTIIAGTWKETKAVSNGIIQRAMETGQSIINMSPRENIICAECSRRNECTETAGLECPIFLDGKVIGCMGLICDNNAQRERLIAKKDSLLSFVEGMCELISSKLKEHDMLEKIKVQNLMLDQILNTISDGYVILNSENRITNVNKHALRILGINEGTVKNKRIDEILPDLDLKNILHSSEYTSYDEVKIRDKVYGVFITAMNKESENVGIVISFKKVDKFGSRIYSKAFQNRQITFDDIIGKSKAIERAKELARTVADNSANILILGESGTGKELFARAIHYSSDRYDNPFISINCAAIPKELLESELFGYETGAFTGASRAGKPGKFELANKGTIFLDEVGDMPFYLQAKILKVLQDRTIERVGGIEQRDIDVRIISATNKNLEKMVEEGNFREDLYYRLNVIPITVPPLRERHGDVQLLLEHFMDEYLKKFNVENKIISKNAIDILNSYNWPGNVRELENLVQYLITVNIGEIIQEDILPRKLLNKVREDTDELEDSELISLKTIEKRAIYRAIKKYGSSTEGKLRAAKVLGISKTTLYRKLAEYNIKQ